MPSGNQGVKMGVGSFTINPRILLAELLLPISVVLGYVGDLVPNRGKFLPEETAVVPLNWKSKLPLCH